MSEFFDPADIEVTEQAQQQHFQALLKRAQAGSQQAAQELHDTYVKYVQRCVRHKMWRRLRTRFDSTDFVQQVWASFFADGRKLPDFETPQELIAFLQTVAQRKVMLESRRQHLQKGNIQRELPINEQSDRVGPHPAAQDPTPSAIAVYHEQYQRLVEEQVPEVREVAVMRTQGSTFAEIAASLEIDESTARRFMRRIRRRGGEQAGE